MKLEAMRKKTVAELSAHADKLRDSINDKRQSLYTSDEKGVREIRKARKELARTLTITREKQAEKEADNA